jgi:hypothetical protein
MKELQTLRTQYRVGDFVSWMRQGTLRLNPNFQRRPVWKKGAKSYLIDTIVRGLPVPIIFLRDLRTDVKTLNAQRDVVDGQQRIRTILSFIDPRLLPDFDVAKDEFAISEVHNAELGNRKFADLPEDYKQRILDYQFSVHSFPTDTDDREILQIFARMNSTGVKLNAQELRNAEFFGLFKTHAYSLALEQLNRWRDWKIFTPDQIARMHEVELTSEFMLLIMGGVMEKENKTINEFYDRFDKSFGDSKEVSKRFRKIFETIESEFSAEELRTFRKRTVFYALFAALYDLLYTLLPPPKRKMHAMQKLVPEASGQVKAGDIRMIKDAGVRIARNDVPARVFKALRGATTHASERLVLVRFLLGKE